MSQYFFHCSIFLEHKYSACSVKPAACHLTQICPATICIPLCRFESILVVNAFSNLHPTTFQPFDGAHWWILIPRNKCVAITFCRIGDRTFSRAASPRHRRHRVSPSFPIPPQDPSYLYCLLLAPPFTGVSVLYVCCFFYYHRASV